MAQPQAQHAAEPHKPHATLQTLLALLLRMPWVTEHRYGCPAADFGGCMCGASDLQAAIHELSAPPHA